MVDVLVNQLIEIKGTKYDLGTGRILYNFSCPRMDFERQAFGGAGVVEGEFGYDHWIDQGVAVPRPNLPISIENAPFQADDRDEVVLSGFPDPCMIFVDGEEYELTGGTLTLTSPMPAIYKISCSHWPYLDWETTVEAVA